MTGKMKYSHKTYELTELSRNHYMYSRGYRYKIEIAKNHISVRAIYAYTYEHAQLLLIIKAEQQERQNLDRDVNLMLESPLLSTEIDI